MWRILNSSGRRFHRARAASPERRIEYRVGIHLGDVAEESDGDLMGDGVYIAARLEGVAKPGAISLSEDAYRQVKQRLDLKVTDLGATQLKNIAEPVHVYSLEVGQPAEAKPASAANAAVKPESWASTSRSSRWFALAAITAPSLRGRRRLVHAPRAHNEAGAGCPSLDRGASAYESLRRGA